MLMESDESAEPPCLQGQCGDPALLVGHQPGYLPSLYTWTLRSLHTALVLLFGDWKVAPVQVHVMINQLSRLSLNGCAQHGQDCCNRTFTQPRRRQGAQDVGNKALSRAIAIGYKQHSTMLDVTEQTVVQLLRGAP